MDSKWRDILEKVERGELTPEQGAELLAAQTRQLESQPVSSDPKTAANPTAGDQTPAQAEVVEDYSQALHSWKSWWVLPLLVGVLILALSGWAMSSAVAAEHLFWFYCAILPALLGAMIVILSLWSRKSRWLHVRVRGEEGGPKKNVSISMPIPTTLVGWVMRTFGHQIPGLREQPEVIKMMPDIMGALQDNDDPLVVEVNEKDGSEVRVYIL